ncbi:tyrosine-protein phosphatase non-receptor type 2-like [Scleropages formosus]|uniref:Tyrosine-protein phosphatase non-receptor type n=1 Tax=Scleropages formosus TaxID=113540 RepID=A0A0P7UZ91_SCLFO|nr:tyrosine-protein phosphatase non-receptor type 2-like isoform X1 [Scleropages formosus]KPP75538.1 tyrosine-protein phosphatase non-receptor type 2-like [Scleropages formosus]
MERQFEDIDSTGRWHNLYMEIRNLSHECSYKVAKYPENRIRNRYRDVSPYDHSRVKLKNLENDYINASLIVMEEAQRNYILTQGPLRNTCGHFWLMVWEQRTKAVIMLNRVIEKGSEKCAQYWPTPEEREMSFKDTNFVVKLLSEDVKSYYTIRVLELQNTDTQETREIYHFHYTTWPDFGVPESPASFLNFLFKVRESGSLEVQHGPSVVHCSAGIGRSGTFSLVDTCLVLMDKRKDPSSVDIQKVLLEMRKYRMGLIQTPDQLRFSYMAIIEGAKYIMGDRSVKNEWQELANEGQEPVWESSEPPPPPPRPTDKLNGDGYESKEADWPKQDHEESIESCTRQRHREARRAATAQKVQQMKQRLYDTEQKRQRWLYWRPILLGVGAGVTLALGLYIGWGMASQ